MKTSLKLGTSIISTLPVDVAAEEHSREEERRLEIRAGNRPDLVGMFPAIEQGEQSIGYTRPKTRLAGDAGTVIAINPMIPRIPNGSASMDPSPSRLPTTAPVEIAVSSPDTQLPAISLIFIYVQQRFPHPRTPMPRHLHTLRCPKYKLNLGAPGGCFKDLRLTFRESPAVLSTRPCKNNFLHPSSVVCFFSNLTHTAKTWDCK